jgi:superfamily II DNA or RNA helicase
MDRYHIDFETITGNDDNDTRQRRVKAFVKGDTGVLVGTVFGEGVDIPEIECVINAEGGRDVKATVQRMRNLTPSAGKTEAVFIDFIDVTNSYFAEHTAERIASYRSESAFDIKIVG